MKKSKLVCDIIAGFDMVNEEDTTAPLKDCVSMLEEAKETLKGDCCFYFHGNYLMIMFYYYLAGESTHRKNENLYDAVLMGSKRIGHGFNLAMHPHL